MAKKLLFHLLSNVLSIALALKIWQSFVPTSTSPKSPKKLLAKSTTSTNQAQANSFAGSGLTIKNYYMLKFRKGNLL
jgi:hypothetical protein